MQQTTSQPLERVRFDHYDMPAQTFNLIITAINTKDTSWLKLGNIDEEFSSVFLGIGEGRRVGRFRVRLGGFDAVLVARSETGFADTDTDGLGEVVALGEVVGVGFGMP